MKYSLSVFPTFSTMKVITQRLIRFEEIYVTFLRILWSEAVFHVDCLRAVTSAEY